MSTQVEAYPAITGLGMAIPEQVVDNNALIEQLTKGYYSDDVIRKMVGIEERRWADPDEPFPTSKLAIEAAEGAVAMAGLDVTRLGDIYVATNSPDSLSPKYGQ